MKRMLYLLVAAFLLSCTKHNPANNNDVAVDLHNCLHFTTNSSANIAIKYKRYPDVVNLQYSMDGCSTWKDYQIDQVVSLRSGDTVFFKATTCNEQFSTRDGNYYYFEMSGTVFADGNIMSLLDETMQRNDVPPCCFQGLFEYCTSLKTSPELPATYLYAGCYIDMFYGCTSLTQAPALPATTLANYCYSGMFYDCTSLTQAPALPATTLAEGCYSFMFSGCTSLTQAPALPANILADDSYVFMFSECSSLVQPPSLPATTLSKDCYAFMFASCTSLIDLPTLPAVCLPDGCYKSMFSGCYSLIVNTSEPGKQWSICANQVGTDALQFMFSSTKGTMNGTPEINTVYYIYSAQ